MSWWTSWRAIISLLAVAATSAGCAGVPAAPGGQVSTAPRQAERKALVIAEGREVDSMLSFGNTDNEATEMAHAGLVVRNAVTFQEEPWLAEERPSIEKGTWRVNPDGTMVTTYRLRPNILWHDGTSLSPQDFVFGREANLDTRLPYRNRRQVSLMDRIDTPDERTLVITWNTTFPLADRLFRSELTPLPRHILEPLYRSGDLDRFVTSPYWNREFVGTGPYRVVDFQPGALIEFEAFEQYFLGRPKIDRVSLRIISDSNIMLTNVLTNEVHLTLRSALTFEGGLVAKDQWEAQGSGRVLFTPTNWSWVNLSGLNPWFDDVRVRRAMLHAIDREEIVRTLFRGEEAVVHVPFSPRRPQFARADAAVVKYEYNPQRAQALLAEVGWTRGPDGVLLNSQGERFSFEARTTAGRREEEQVQQATIGYWTAVGAELQINNLPDRVLSGEEFRNRWPGAYWGSHNIVIEDWADRFHTSNIPGPENRWSRINVSRWANPQKDAIVDEMNATLDRARWDDLVVQFARVFTEDLPHLPMKYSSEVMTVAKGLQGIGPRIESGGENARTWNVHLWEWQ